MNLRDYPWGIDRDTCALWYPSFSGLHQHGDESRNSHSTFRLILVPNTFLARRLYTRSTP